MEHKPKIVLGITLAKPGGATSFVFGFAQWLKQKGYKPTVIAGEGEWLYERCRTSDIPCLRVPSLQREILPWYDLPAFFHLYRILHQLKPDIIQLNSTKMGAAGSLAARLAGVPRVVYCIAGWVFLENISSRKKKIYEYIERWTAPFKDAIVCVNPGDTQAARKRHIQPRQELLDIPNGIDLSIFDDALKPREEARRLLNLPLEAFIYGSISHFYPAKDLPRYMEACARIRDTNPQARFVIIGEGMQRPQIEQKIKEYQLEQTVILVGAKEQAWQYLLAFDAFVLPSSKEGMPFVLLEAMAARLPCIVTDVGANRWVLGEEGGWIVPAQSPKDLAEAMAAIQQHPEQTRTRGIRARVIVEQRFPLEKTYQAHLALLLKDSLATER